MDYKEIQNIYNNIHFSYFNRRHPVVFLILKINYFILNTFLIFTLVIQMLQMATHMLVEMHVHA